MSGNFMPPSWSSIASVARIEGSRRLTYDVHVGVEYFNTIYKGSIISRSLAFDHLSTICTQLGISTPPSNDAKRWPSLAKHLSQVSYEELWLLVSSKVPSCGMLGFEYQVVGL